MQAVLDAIERIPVATITHVFVALILGIDLIVQGSLSSDALTYAGIVEGGNIGVAGARAHVAGKKVDAAASRPAIYSGTAITQPVKLTVPSSPSVADAPDEPGDPDGLSHISTTTETIPRDQGDAGEAGR